MKPTSNHYPLLPFILYRLPKSRRDVARSAPNRWSHANLPIHFSTPSPPRGVFSEFSQLHNETLGAHHFICHLPINLNSEDEISASSTWCVDKGYYWFILIQISWNPAKFPKIVAAICGWRQAPNIGESSYWYQIKAWTDSLVTFY